MRSHLGDLHSRPFFPYGCITPYRPQVRTPKSRHPCSNGGTHTHTRHQHQGGYNMLPDPIPQAARLCLCQIHHNQSNYVRLNQLIKVASRVYNEGFSFIQAKLAPLDYSRIWFETETTPNSPSLHWRGWWAVYFWLPLQFNAMVANFSLNHFYPSLFFAFLHHLWEKNVCAVKSILPSFII